MNISIGKWQCKVTLHYMISLKKEALEIILVGGHGIEGDIWAFLVVEAGIS